MTIPEPARAKLEHRLHRRRDQRWPALRDLAVRYRGDFAYITGTDDDGPLPLCRLRYSGSPDQWGFACYLASKDGYQDSILPTGSFTGTPEEALDCACGLYLNDPSAWAGTPHDSRNDL
ncbi:MAG: hypothetical protein ACRDRT_04190 [Pseudonocardiaceae bacterium]